MGLGQFDEAKQCYESLRELGEKSTAENYLKKLAEAQERVWYLYLTDLYSCKINNKISSTEIDKTNNQAWRIDHMIWFISYETYRAIIPYNRNKFKHNSEALI